MKMMVEVEIPDEDLICPSCVALAKERERIEIEKPCFNCGQRATENHHIVPKSLGGIATVPLCIDCHGKAHHDLNRTSMIELGRSSRLRMKQNGEDLGGTVKPWKKRQGVGKERILVDDPEKIELISEVARLLAIKTKYKEITAQTGVSGGTISNWKKQLDDPTSEMSKKIAEKPHQSG